MNRRPIFDAVRKLRNGRGFRMAEVRLLDAAIDQSLAVVAKPQDVTVSITVPTPPSPPAQHRKISQKGIDLIHSFESCKLEAYPDPGSRDGHPWTIGWGSTGPDIKKGLVWTQEQCDERFKRDIAKYEQAVDRLTRDVPTNQNQFDAMVSLCYNIGATAFQRSTVLRKHRTGDFLSAARAFLLWNKNDGRVMRGLTRRRLAEADLYDD